MVNFVIFERGFCYFRYDLKLFERNLRLKIKHFHSDKDITLEIYFITTERTCCGKPTIVSQTQINDKNAPKTHAVECLALNSVSTLVLSQEDFTCFASYRRVGTQRISLAIELSGFKLCMTKLSWFVVCPAVINAQATLRIT